MSRNTAIFAWIVAIAVYLVMLAWSLPVLTAFTGGLPVFDMMPTGYSFTQASELILALGPDGKVFYLGTQHKIDLIYPLSLGIAFSLSFRLLYRGNIARILVALAAVAAGLDLLENSAVAEMLTAGQMGLTEDMVVFASRITIAKSVVTSLAFLALLVGFARSIWRRFSKHGRHFEWNLKWYRR